MVFKPYAKLQYDAPLGTTATMAGFPNLVSTTIHNLLHMRSGLVSMSFDSAERINRGEPHKPAPADWDIDFARRYNSPEACTLHDWCRAHAPLPHRVGVFDYQDVNFDILAHLAPYVLNADAPSLLQTIDPDKNMQWFHTRHGHVLGSTGLVSTSAALCDFASKLSVADYRDYVLRSSVELSNYAPERFEIADTQFDGYAYGWWTYQSCMAGIGSQGQRLIISNKGALCKLHATGMQLQEYDWLVHPEKATSWRASWEVATDPAEILIKDMCSF